MKSPVKVIRNRVLITHTEPGRREIVDEVTLFNDSGRVVRDIFLQRLSFMPALRVFDYDGAELVHYPNDFTRILFTKLSKTDSSYEEILKRMKSKDLFVLWVTFPKGREIRPKDSRIIRLAYFDKENPSTVKRSIFSIPRYVYDKFTPADEAYNTFWNVAAPPGFRLKHETLEASKTVDEKPEKLTRDDGLFIDLTDSLISIRIPFLPTAVRYKMAYNVELPVAEAWFLRIGFLVLLIASIFSAISPQLTSPIVLYHVDMAKLLLENRYSIAGIITTICVAVIGFLSNPLTKRTKWLFLIPILITMIGFLVF
jgi:hypothetical protein